MSYCDATAGTETSAPLVSGIVNRSVSLQPIHQSATSNHSHPALLSGRLVTPDFVVIWIRRGMFIGHKSWSSWRWPRSLRLLHFRSGGSEWCIECQGRHNLWKRSRSAESIKSDKWYIRFGCLKIPIILFISSRWTICNWC